MVFLMKLLHHLSCHNAKIASFCPTRLLQYYPADGAVYNLASRGCVKSAAQIKAGYDQYKEDQAAKEAEEKANTSTVVLN